MNSTEIRNDPRWNTDPGALFDELERQYGWAEANRRWQAACTEAEAASEQTEQDPEFRSQ